MKRIALLVLVLLLSAPLYAQNTQPQLQAMKKLDFLIGEWQGEGWTEFVAGQRRSSPITEKVEPRLGGMILLVEGLGKKKAEGQQNEVVVHNALGIISFDTKANLYRLKTFLADGRSTDAEARFVDEAFQWSFQTPQGLSIRYTTKLTDKGEWFEKGEMSQDGKNWRQFHEMTLKRVK
jgi:hypothetical protein